MEDILAYVLLAIAVFNLVLYIYVTQQMVKEVTHISKIKDKTTEDKIQLSTKRGLIFTTYTVLIILLCIAMMSKGMIIVGIASMIAFSTVLLTEYNLNTLLSEIIREKYGKTSSKETNKEIKQEEIITIS